MEVFMYGMVNKAFQEMVSIQFGEDKWDEIKDKAGLDIDVFVSMEPYPDEITGKIVGAASEVLTISAEDFLMQFGEFWVSYAANSDYGEIFDISGNTFVELLQNLNDLHTRVGNIMHQLDPPSFKCTDIRKNSLQLHYYSNRKGLAPMVVGLLKGLATRFKTEIEITHLASSVEGADHDKFLIKYKKT